MINEENNTGSVDGVKIYLLRARQLEIGVIIRERV